MKKIIRAGNVLALVLSSIMFQQAKAEIVNFNDVYAGQDFGSVEHVHGNYYMDNYYDISDKESQDGWWFQRLVSWGDQPDYRQLSMDKYGRAVFNQLPGSTTSITHLDNEAFNFHSIKLADTGNGAGTLYSVVFKFYAFGSDDFTSTTIQMLSVPFGENFVFDQKNLSRVEWTSYYQGIGSTIQFDDIVVSAVPEPSTYAMLLAGMGMVGAIARRRGKAKQS